MPKLEEFDPDVQNMAMELQNDDEFSRYAEQEFQESCASALEKMLASGNSHPTKEQVREELIQVLRPQGG